MQEKLLEILVCPRCKKRLSCVPAKTAENGNIIEGELACSECGRVFEVANGIPRFIEADNYASSFGYQWNLFRKEQIDSHNGTDLSAWRFWGETGWDKGEMKGNWVLDAGCGAGRFIDVSSGTEAEVVGIDLSNAVDAAQENLAGRQNAHFVQASIYELPFREGTFDKCYCIGVVQHTPDPPETLASLAKMVKPDGKIAVTIYERKPWTYLFSKYWLRLVTKHISGKTLLSVIRGIMPVAFPVTDVLFRIPALGKIFMFMIPIANYVNENALTRKQRYDWAILDTFDMLAPKFDQPQTEAEAENALSKNEIVGIERVPTPGLTLTGTKASQI
jgi:2-polyprenyl-3-methyl-5-hydroxy-6-metoxy-1,4-benzoquinol methylase/uncharacterized protein YbaR (Trm112 family)